ncbi:MAG: HAMP domain-containing histidine kinase, partial [Candidatus Aminicenantes bacterium]|nr:HAMP domain-containing histidine kinase [Candidatus Aminicenantes bacterium]
MILSLFLTLTALREAEREKLLNEKDWREGQLRCAEIITEQIISLISALEDRFVSLWDGNEPQRSQSELFELCRKIFDGEELIKEIFFINGKGGINFPLSPSLNLWQEEGQVVVSDPPAYESNPLFQSAQVFEFQLKNYPQAIKSYKGLMDDSSDKTVRAQLLNCVARCYRKSGNLPESLRIYRVIHSEYPSEISTDGAPLGILALYQIGNSLWKSGQKLDGDEVFVDLYEGILNFEWPLTDHQFNFYRDRVKNVLAVSLDALPKTEKGEELIRKWDSLQSSEKKVLLDIKVKNDLLQKVVPLIHAKRPVSGADSRMFSHISEIFDAELYFVSFASLGNNQLIAFQINSEVLTQRSIPGLIKNLPLKEGWSIHVLDASGFVLAGSSSLNEDSTNPPALTKVFDDSFLPWKISVYQDSPTSLKRHFIKKRNLYLLSVIVVMIALFFGGFFAIKSTAKELEVAKLKSEFASTVSHEFRTPLTSIRYLADMLKRGRVKESERKQEYYEAITSESERLSRLVENMLDYSKIEAGMKEYRFKETEVAALSREVVLRLQDQARAQDISIICDISDEIPVITADQEAISRALSNILDNALKYS